MTTPEIPEFSPGERLRKARQHAGIPVAELAQMLGVNRRTVGRYENGAIPVRQHWAVLYEHATGVQATWIMTGEIAPETPENPANTGDNLQKGRKG